MLRPEQGGTVRSQPHVGQSVASEMVLWRGHFKGAEGGLHPGLDSLAAADQAAVYVRVGIPLKKGRNGGRTGRI